MRETGRSFRIVLRAVVLLIALGLVLNLSAPGPAVTAAQQKPSAQAAQLQIPGVRTQVVKVSPELQKVIANKKAFNPAQLRGTVTYRGQIPLLRLTSGKQVALEPLRAEPQPSQRERDSSLKVSAAVQKYLAHIRRQWVGPVVTVPTGPPDSVSHEACQTPIRDQLDRGTCVAHASMAGLEAFFNCGRKTALDLSEQHAYHFFMEREASTCRADSGLQTWRAAGYLTSGRVCTEAGMAYTNMAGLPTTDTGHVPAPCAKGATYGYVTTQLMFGTEFGGETWINANNTNYLESVLSSGYDIVYGLKVAGTDWNDGSAETGVVDVQVVGGSPAPAYAGHAMLLVGYNRPAQYFVFKNSWGSDRGHAGYFRVSYAYLQTYGKYGFYILSVTP